MRATFHLTLIDLIILRDTSYESIRYVVFPKLLLLLRS
jgi:hypothetical protein